MELESKDVFFPTENIVAFNELNKILSKDK